MDDDSRVRIIQRLSIDTSLAVKNIRELAKELGVSTKDVRKFVKEIEQSWKELDKARTAEGTRQKQEEKMWAQLARQKEAARKAEQTAMQREIRMFEQNERTRMRIEEQRTSEAMKAAAREAAEKAKLAAYEDNLRAKLALRAQKEAEAAAVALPNLSAQLTALQARAKVEGVLSVALRTRLADLSKETAAMRQQVSVSGKLTDEQVKRVRSLQAEAKVINANITQMAAAQLGSVGGSLSNMLGRRIEWFLAGSAFFGFQNAVRQAVTDVADIEYRMTALARVMEDPAFELDEMREAIFALGQEFGFSFQQVQDVVLRWAQAGYDVRESIEATRASLLALNTAELDAEQATMSLIGIMSQWGLEANQLIAVIDRINRVSDDYAVTSQDLVDGLLRSSGAARAANLTFEQTLALVTAMREASGRTGKEVGNALNSILAYVQRAKSINTLQQAGIAVFSDEQGTKLRSVFDLLSDLSAKWSEMEESGLSRTLMEEADAAGLFTEEIAEASGALEEWTDLQRRDILQAGAGVYRRNYLLALLNNFTKVYEVLETQERALGYSQRENQRTMETAIKQWAAFKTELQQLGYTLAAESGPLAMLKALVATLRQGVDAFNRLPTTTKQVISALAMLGATFGLLNLTSKQFFGTTLSEGLKAARTGIQGLLVSLGGLGPAMLKIAPVIAVVAGVAYGITKVNEQAYRLQREYEDLQQANDQAMRTAELEAKVHSQNAILLADLADKYRALEKAKQDGGNSADIAAEQEDITRRIEDALGREVTARLKAQEFSKEAAEIVQKAEKSKADAAVETANTQIESYRQTLRAQMEQASKSIDIVENQLDGWESYLTFFERAKLWIVRPYYWIREALAAMAEDWFMFLYRFQTTMAEVNDFLGFDGIAEKNREAAKKNFEWAYKFREQQFRLEKELAEREADLAEGPLNRQRKLLADLREEIARTTLETGDVTAGTGGGGFSPPPSTSEGISAIIDGIVAETEALGVLNAATQRHIDLVEARIAHNTRESATLEELQKADEDRAELLSLLTSRQEQLHLQAEAARAAYQQLAVSQQGINTSTEDGAKAFADISRAMERMLDISGDASTEWWQLHREIAEIQRANNAASVVTIQQLDELKQKYDDGLVSLERYIEALARLEDQTGLSAEATKRLNEAQAEALQTAWKSAIAEALTTEKERIQGEVAAIEEALAKFEALGKYDERNTARSKATSALQALLGTTPAASMPSDTGITNMVQAVLDQFENLDFGELSPDEFADVIGADLRLLRDFSTTASGYLDTIGAAAEQRLGAIADELASVDTWLQSRLAELQAQLDALDEEEKQDEREKATEDHNERLQKLQDELTWNMLQGEDERAFEIAAIRKQIAEEEERWAEEQAKWRKADQRESIQDQMEAARREAEERRKALEEERKALQEQQTAMTAALNAILTYIASEMQARKQALEDEKESLSDTSKELDETLGGVEDDVLGTLAIMAAQDHAFYERAKSLIGKIIEGINDKKGSLRSAVDEINRIIGSIRGGSVDVVVPSPTPPNTPPPPQGKFRPMAEGGLVRGGRGGMLALIAEKAYDELVLPVPKIRPLIAESMQAALRSIPSQMPGADLAAAVNRLQASIQNMSFSGYVNVTLPDGTVERQFVKFMSGFGQASRG